eukprot:jgi/Chlat1/6416/Chrsp45S05924
MQSVQAYVDAALAASRKLNDNTAVWDPREGEVLALEEFLQLERSREEVSDYQHIHNKLIFDAINEAITKLYPYGNRPERQMPSWMRSSHLSRVPVRVYKVKEQVRRMVMRWAACGGKTGMLGDNLDAIIIQDLQEEDRWNDFSEDEVELKFELSDMIFEDLLTDTVQVMNAVEAALARTR